MNNELKRGSRIMITQLVASRDELNCSDEQWRQRRRITGEIGNIVGAEKGKVTTYLVCCDDGISVGAYRVDELLELARRDATQDLIQRWLPRREVAAQLT